MLWYLKINGAFLPKGTAPAALERDTVNLCRVNPFRRAARDLYRQAGLIKDTWL
jgi:hypothetical protein